jgi:hypothetical protein
MAPKNIPEAAIVPGFANLYQALKEIRDYSNRNFTDQACDYPVFFRNYT